jgi:hypothetical protein
MQALWLIILAIFSRRRPAMAVEANLVSIISEGLALLEDEAVRCELEDSPAARAKISAALLAAAPFTPDQDDLAIINIPVRPHAQDGLSRRSAVKAEGGCALARGPPLTPLNITHCRLPIALQAPPARSPPRAYFSQ